jgi:hypothetical protein
VSWSPWLEHQEFPQHPCIGLEIGAVSPIPKWETYVESRIPALKDGAEAAFIYLPPVSALDKPKTD